MAEVIREPWTEKWTEYSVEFHRKGEKSDFCFSFPCDEDGNVYELNDAAQMNYDNVSTSPEWERKFREEKRTCRHERTIKCDCGYEFEFFNEYYGTCGCPECNRWYNLFGQSVKAPNEYDIDSEY